MTSSICVGTEALVDSAVLAPPTIRTPAAWYSARRRWASVGIGVEDGDLSAFGIGDAE